MPIRKMNMPLLYRAATIDKIVDVEARTVQLSFSSEAAVVPRWFGGEILDHSKSSVRLDRIRSAGAVMLDHSEFIGAPLEVSIDADRVGRATVKLGRSALAAEVLQDIKDEVRKNTSVGYRVHKMVLEESTDEGDIYRVIDWEPYEISIVGVPADIGVGVGRSSTTQEFEVEIESSAKPTEEKAMPEKAADQTNKPVDVRAVENDVRERELARIRELEAIGERYKIHGGVDLAREAIRSGKTLDELRHSILERLPKPDAIGAGDLPKTALSKKEQRSYSLTRGLMAMVERSEGRHANSFELELSDEMEKNLPQHVKRHGGLYMPFDIEVRAGLDSKTATAGQELVVDQPGDFLALLRNKMLVRQLGANVLEGLQGNIPFPKQTGGGTATWVAENPGSDVAESNMTTGSATMTPRILQSTTSYSRQLLAQSSFGVDQLVRSDLAQASALAVDLGAIAGTGASNQPTGILNTAGVGLVAIGTNGGAPTYEHMVDLQTAIDDANAVLGTIAYLTTAVMRGKLKKTQQFSGTNGAPVWVKDEVDGYGAFSTKQVPSNLTKGTSTDCHAIILGVWSQLMIGFWGPGLEIVVDPYRLKKQGMIEVTSYLMADIMLRYAAAFAAIKDARNV